MRKTVLALAAPAVASVLAVAGCGGSYGNEEAGSSSNAASTGGSYGPGGQYGSAEKAGD